MELATAEVTSFAYDYRNRLTATTEYSSANAVQHAFTATRWRTGRDGSRRLQFGPFLQERFDLQLETLLACGVDFGSPRERARIHKLAPEDFPPSATR